MAAQRYVLNFRGTPPLPAEDLALIESKATIVDTSRKSLLVTVEQAGAADELAQQLADWTVQPETRYPIPNTRPTVRKPPSS